MDQGKKSLIALLFIFVAPVLLGTLVFFNKEKLGIGTHTVNYGTLVTPAVPLQIEGVKLADKDATSEQLIQKKWTLLYIAPQDCDTFCKDRLLLMKRLRLLMNEDMRRIRTVLVSTSPEIEKHIAPEYPDFVIAWVTNEDSAFLKQFRKLQSRPIYLIDPLGNLMMFYPQQTPNHKLIIKDLKRLLKYSRIG